jgi:hypothetical protein
MKTLYFPVLLFLLLLLASCGKEEGSTPVADPRDALEGSWSDAESSKHFGNSTYTVTIVKSASDEKGLIIKNLYNLGQGVVTIGTVSGSAIILASQQVSSQTISGKGTFSSSKITWTYYTDDGVQKDTCTATSSK